MFKYSNQVVVNSKVDETSGKDKFTYDATNKILKVLRVGNFKLDNIVSMFKATPSEGTKGSVSIPISDLDATANYRIALYLRRSGDNDSYYSNAQVLKGKPFVYEFPGTINGVAATPASIAKLINKINHIYEDSVLTVTAGAEAVVITGDKFSLFTKAQLEKYVPATDSAEGYWSVVAFGTITKNVQEFGTYSQILKDLRLPSYENYRFTSPNIDEMPIAGATYNQYTIEYKVDRGILGTDAVGDEVTSITHHVFFINTALTDVETVMQALATALATKYKAVANNTVHTTPELNDDGTVKTPITQG
jgi:hypothetical protein